MAKFTPSERKAIPSSKFAIPGRRFPITDADHAKAALMDVNKAKNLTPGERSEIRAEARKELHRNHPLPRNK